MSKTIIEKIIAEKIPCFFVSPHLDDAVLSAGGLIAHFSKHTKVEIVNVFSQASEPPYTLSGKTNLKQHGYTDAVRLFEDRKKEDRAAFAHIGKETIDLGFVDGLWRKIEKPAFWRRAIGYLLPEILHVHPTFALHITRDRIPKHDEQLMFRIENELKKLTSSYKEFYIFCPLALRRAHIDHFIVREVCLNAFENVILWEDYPYNDRMNGVITYTGISPRELFRWDGEKDIKKKMISAYTSQVPGLFPGGRFQLIDEVYYQNQEKRRNVRSSKCSYVKPFFRDFRLFIQSPKNYLYTFAPYKREKVQIVPWSKEIADKGFALAEKIRLLAPGLQVHYVGSAALGIAGRNDVDLYIECQPEDFDKYEPIISSVVGSPFVRRAAFVEWSLEHDGYSLDILLSHRGHRGFRETIELFDRFYKYPELISEYEQIKLSSDGLTDREYTRRRMFFFNRVLKKYPI